MSGPPNPGFEPFDLLREQARLKRAGLPSDLPDLKGASGEDLKAWVERQLAARGAQVLRDGGLLAFPTETVYGVGADIRRPEAVARLYRVKGRPGSHPVIVHVGTLEAARSCALGFSALAERLAARFWPGPLTLIVEKAAEVPDSVTGSQSSVGLRIPSHPLALALLRNFGGAVAAPSANRFGKVSPTTADHVAQDLGLDVDAVLDGGPCRIGVESTILDVRGPDPVILRPGGMTREALEAEWGRPLTVHGETTLRVSGGLPSHYAPRARVDLVEESVIESRAEEYRAKGLKVKMLRSSDVEAPVLYASLRKADEEGVDVVLAPRPSEAGLGLAVADRLKRAAGPRT